MQDPVASACELTVRYGTQLVLDRATIAIGESERVGLVGRNGSGKSTFLRIAAEELEPDAGRFIRRRDLITGYLPQVFALDEEQTVGANIRAGAQRVLELIARYEDLPGESPDASVLLDRINHYDGWSIDHRVESLADHLGAPARERTVSTLSGGEKRRVALCRALLARPDFLILDEPTNHLDTESIEWLEDFLARYAGACLFVTHDRYFLERVTTRIIELSRGTFISYTGSYNDYLLTKAERDAAEDRVEHKRQMFLKHELEWVRRGPSARRTKSVDRIERYFEEAARKGPEEVIDVDMIIPPAPTMGNRLITLTNIGVTLAGRVLFHDLNLDLSAGQRLGIVGRNGTGKSTLLKVMVGELVPTHGEVIIGAQTRINYIDQNRLALDDNKTVWEEVGGGGEHVRIGDENLTLRTYLRRFLFTEDRINTKISQLSGGERSRILLAKILRRGGNILIFDEPTNDLDLATLRLLEEALLGFGGTVVVVSHDRYFLNRICTDTLAFEGEGVVTLNAGNYDYYRDKKASGAGLAAPTAGGKSSNPASGRRRGSARKLTYKETRELESMEKQILEVEGVVVELEAAFAAPDFYQKHGDDWQELEARLKQAKKEVPRLYARWEELEAIKKNSGE